MYSDFILQLKKKFNLRIFIYNLVFLVSFLTIIYKFQNNLIIELKNELKIKIKKTVFLISLN